MSDVKEGKKDMMKEIILYQPIRETQSLLPEIASSLAVEAFMKMCNVGFQVVEKRNAEDMSPSGVAPFIKSGLFLASGFQSITEFVAPQHLSSNKQEVSPFDVRAIETYVDVVQSVLQTAETYMVWVNKTNLPFTEQRYGSVHPFPLNWMLTRRKRSEVHKQLAAQGWLGLTSEEVLVEVNMFCQALTSRLGEDNYFFGTMTELDALVFAHIYAILNTPLQCNGLAETVSSHSALVRHCHYFNSHHFSPIG